MLTLICIGILSLTLIIYSVLFLLWKFNYKTYQKTHAKTPTVSLLIACRNEVENIPKLIDNLLKLDYPKSKLEILIGNDDSEDNTLELLNNITEVHIRIFNISTSLNQLKGKMNVLAQLAQKSSGEFLLMTDADMEHNPNWIYSLLEVCDKNTGIVAGFTSTKNSNLISGFQQMDYFIGQIIMKVLIDLGNPIYISGNNLLIRKQAYEAIGGYENMSFHLTEDVLLLKAIKEKGYNIKAQFKPNSISKTNALSNISSIINQRKRWMMAFNLMPYWILVFPLLRLSFIPILVFLAFITPTLAISFLLIKLLINFGFSFNVSHKLALKPNFITIMFYDFYELIIYLPALILRLVSKTTIWKNRTL